MPTTSSTSGATRTSRRCEALSSLTPYSLRRHAAGVVRQAVAEARQDLLGDRRHVGARHVVGQRAELGLGQRGVEAGEVLILGELLTYRGRAADDHDTGLDHLLDRLRLAGELDGA